MDIEQLSKSQIILLTLLVSFVTSIATGIVTVSLMEQAPPALTQTVNRIIERTVEKVVPTGQTATAVTTEKTIVVKESDLIAEAVKEMSASLVSVHASSSQLVFLGLGVVLDETGSIMTDSSILEETGTLVVTFSDGSRALATIASRDRDTGTAILQPATTTPDGQKLDFTPATLSADVPALGQTIVVLSGKSIPRIVDGLVTALVPQGEGKDPVIDTNVSADFVVAGSPLVDTEGNFLGVSTSVSRASSPGAFISSSVYLSSFEPEAAKGPEGNKDQ